MPKKSAPLIYVGDFETTVYEGQESTEVWASGLCPLGTEDAIIFHSIAETLVYLETLPVNVTVYYHNLKFDGSFWLYYLSTCGRYKEALIKDETTCKFEDIQKMPKGSYVYLISDMGQWYSITIRTHTGRYINIRDSLKLLPFSVKQIGKSFKTKHQKLDMVYEGYRYAGCTITPEEEDYLKNDLYVVKEALEIMIAQGHNKLTIGACCFDEFKKILGKDYTDWCPDLTKVECPFEEFDNADAFIRKTYRGGWCYLVKGKENKVYHNGISLDVNSLYPSMMHYQSGNLYPVGTPYWFKGEVPQEAKRNDRYFFVCVKTKFRIKPNHLPTIQIKGSIVYSPTEWLETSDVKWRDGKYYDKYKIAGEIHDTRQTLYLTQTDYQLLHDQYDLYEYEEVGGCWFYTMFSVFDQYIDKYKKIKMESKGAVRALAKLFLNNLYGKLACNTNSSFKICDISDETGGLHYTNIEEYNKKVGYIPMGSAITSYARNFTIRCAQANYYGKDKDGFIYADTDSIHCDIPIEQIRSAPLHPTEFCHWKHETTWDDAIFVRQKTYIEHVVIEDDEPLEKPYYNIKCAGMPKRCKDLLANTLGDDNGVTPEYEDEALFLEDKRTLEDFKTGLIVPSKLLPKNIKGGVVLTRTTFEMR